MKILRSLSKSELARGDLRRDATKNLCFKEVISRIIMQILSDSFSLEWNGCVSLDPQDQNTNEYLMEDLDSFRTAMNVYTGV